MRERQLRAERWRRSLYVGGQGRFPVRMHLSQWVLNYDEAQALLQPTWKEPEGPALDALEPARY